MLALIFNVLARVFGNDLEIGGTFRKHQIKIHIFVVNTDGLWLSFSIFWLGFLEMILKLVEHSEKHQIKIHISTGIYSENVNLGFGSHFQCFG